VRLGRTSMAVLTGFIAFGTWLAAEIVQGLVLPSRIDGRISVGAGFAAGVASLWLAERFDLVAPAQTPPVVDLYGKDEPGEREPRA
jgi:hypothetical protein